jgi:hypothetical protein
MDKCFRSGLRSIEATIEELRIMDMSRAGSSDMCEPIFVVNSALHCVQAFDNEGNLPCDRI